MTGTYEILILRIHPHLIHSLEPPTNPRSYLSSSSDSSHMVPALGTGRELRRSKGKGWSPATLWSFPFSPSIDSIGRTHPTQHATPQRTTSHTPPQSSFFFLLRHAKTQADSQTWSDLLLLSLVAAHTTHHLSPGSQPDAPKLKEDRRTPSRETIPSFFLSLFFATILDPPPNIHSVAFYPPSSACTL